MSSIHKCQLCGINASKRCGACNKAWYCSKTHQVSHWKQHKIHCQPESARNNKRKIATTTSLQQLHDDCIGKSVFTEMHLTIKINKSNEHKILQSLQNAIKTIPDTFLYDKRIMIASNNESYHRSIYFKTCDAINRTTYIQYDDTFFKTRYHLTELTYSNGFISSKGVTFLDTNKTIQNTDISELFVSKPYTLKEKMDELTLFGYCRENNKNNVPKEIVLCCLSYYKCVSDEFSSCGDPISIINKSKIEKVKPYVWCCAFGTVGINTSVDTNHYQWILYIDKMNSGYSIGITSQRNVNELFENHDYPNYSYSADGLVENCNQAPCKHKGKTLRFEEGDYILMDLDCSKKQLTFCINGKYEGCVIKDIICGPTYYLGICMASLRDSVSIKRFTWWKCPEISGD